MLKDTRYGLVRPCFDKGVYAKELEEIHNLIESDADTMRFEYESRREAANAYVSIKRYTAELPVGLTRHRECLWVFKTESKAKSTE